MWCGHNFIYLRKFQKQPGFAKVREAFPYLSSTICFILQVHIRQFSELTIIKEA